MCYFQKQTKLFNIPVQTVNNRPRYWFDEVNDNTAGWNLSSSKNFYFNGHMILSQSDSVPSTKSHHPFLPL